MESKKRQKNEESPKPEGTMEGLKSIIIPLESKSKSLEVISRVIRTPVTQRLKGDPMSDEMRL